MCDLDCFFQNRVTYVTYIYTLHVSINALVIVLTACLGHVAQEAGTPHIEDIDKK